MYVMWTTQAAAIFFKEEKIEEGKLERRKEETDHENVS